MSVQLGDQAPDFTAETTEGRLTFHTWKGSSWAVLFSHPRDFTPVCTTELGTLAGLKGEFERRNTKVIGLSVDPLSEHERWKHDIRDVTGHALNFPLIADPDRSVALADRQGSHVQGLHLGGSLLERRLRPHALDTRGHDVLDFHGRHLLPENEPDLYSRGTRGRIPTLDIF